MSARSITQRPVPPLSATTPVFPTPVRTSYPSARNRSVTSVLVRRSSKPSSGCWCRSRRIATNWSRSTGGSRAIMRPSRERGAGSGTFRCKEGTAPRSLLPFLSHPRARAQVAHDALLAFRPPRDAHLAAVQDQQVREHGPLVARQELHQVPLDLLGRVLAREAQQPADAVHVRVHDHALALPEPAAQHDVRGLAADAGEPDEVF